MTNGPNSNTDASGNVASSPAQTPGTDADTTAVIAPVTPTVPASPEPPGKVPTSRSKWVVFLWFLAGVVIVSAAIVAVLGYQRTTTQRAASADLTEASRLVERADSTVIAVDANVRSSIDSTVAAEAQTLLEQVGKANDDLTAAIAIIGDVKDRLPEAEAQQAEALKASAEARLVMLESAQPILETNVMVGTALGPADEAWTALLDADRLSKQSVAEYNKLTKASVTKAKDLATRAETKVKAAKTAFDQAGKAYESADFSAYIVFCDAKIESLVLSRKVDDAYLAGKPADANEIGDKFNAAEERLQQQAKKLPASPRVVIGDAYEAGVKDASAAYAQARAEATKADARYKDLID